MSVATVKAIEEKLKGASTHQLEKYGYTRDSSGHIVPKETAGVAAKPGTTAPAPSVAAKNVSPVEATRHRLEGQFEKPGPLGQAAEGIQEGGKAALNAPGEAATAAAQPIAEGLIDLVKPVALKITLTAVLVLAGMALAGYGVATMLKPQPPDIGKGLKKVAGIGAKAAA